MIAARATASGKATIADAMVVTPLPVNAGMPKAAYSFTAGSSGM
jgi:hypothetical protein